MITPVAPVNPADFKEHWILKTGSGKGLVCQEQTEVIVTEFSNKFFIIASNRGRIGVMVHVSNEQGPESSTSSLNSKVVFGKDKPEVHAVARSLMDRLKLTKPVVFAFSLKEYSAVTVTGLNELVMDVTKNLTTLEN